MAAFDEDGYGTSIDQFKPGHLVELHPGCDRWMMGDRYGEVIRARKPVEGIVRVRLDISGKAFNFEPGRLRYRRY